MSEQKEDIDILSQKELEDGEIEEGELDEPQLISTVDNETELNTEVLDDSDANINDKSTLKIKKHKHHKKGLHRKRHLNSEEKSDGKWKKSKKSNDEDDDEDFSPELIDDKNNFDGDSHQSENIPIENSFKHDSEYDTTDKMQPAQSWGDYESDDDKKVSNNFNKINNQSVLCGETQNKIKNNEIILSPPYEASPIEVEVPPPSEPLVSSKWNDYDSDDEINTTSNSNSKKNTFDEPQFGNTKNFKRWDSNKNNDRDRGWDNNFKTNNENRQAYNSPNRANEQDSNNRVLDNIDLSNSPTDDKVGWGSCSSPSNKNEEKDKKNDLSPKSNIDNFGKWGSYDSSDEKTNDNKPCGFSSSPKRNDDDNPKRGSYGGNDNNQRWGSRNDNQRWGNRDSPKRDDDNNNDDDSRTFGSRDGSRRNNFRRRGGWDGSRRNNNRRWGGRNGRNNEHQRYGSSNNDSPQRGGNNDNKRWGSSNNCSPQRTNEDNDKWGSSNNASPQRGYNDNNNKRWGSSNNGSPSRNTDDNKKWGSSNNSPQRWGSSNNSPQRNNDENNKFGSNNNASPQRDTEKNNQESYDLPQKSSWGDYDSDDDNPKPSVTENKQNISTRNDTDDLKWGSSNSPQQRKTDNFNNWDTQSSPKPVNDSVEASSGGNKWSYDSDDEGKPTVKENSFNNNNTDNNQSSWKSYDSDGESKGTFNDNRNKGGYNSSWNKNDRNDFKNDRNDFKNDRNDFKNDRSDRNDRNKRWTNEKRNVCKYFSMGSCRHGDRCTFLHESPTKSVTQEAKKKELCKFYEHQQCYKRVNCTFMHEEFPCKLFHAGSKMCPSGDSCKYSHAPLNQETKALLEKYLDEKVDERTEKNSSEWSSIIKKSSEDDLDDNTPTGFDPPENFFPDPMRYRFPGSQDMMRFPVRPWNAMMRYGDMSIPVPHQMEFMHRQRFAACQYPMNTGRLFPRNFRGMVPPNMHEGFPNGMPFSIPPLMSTNPKLHTAELNVSDPYIDNLAQLVVGKDSTGSPKRLVDMLDPNMQCDDMDDFPLEVETTNSKQALSSPIMMKSPEIPPGAYVPRTSMNIAQPNVRLGPGPGYGGEQAMMYGGYPGHPVETTMMDYINMSAIHYYHNEAMAAAYDVPWKLLILEVPIKIPYPLMVIDTQDMPHKHTDPRLKGHPSVLNSNSANDDTVLHHNSYDFNSISNFGSQLSSPNFVTSSSDASAENMTTMADFLSKPEEPESPIFPISGSDDIFNFKNRMETEEYGRKNTDRSYLQDPRFKRKKVILNTTLEPSDLME